jgi:hypothetical protein
MDTVICERRVHRDFFFFPVLGFKLRVFTSPLFVMGFLKIGSCELFALAGFKM